MNLIDNHEHNSLFVSSSLKNEIDTHEHSLFSLSSSLKTKTYDHENSSLAVSSLLKNETYKHDHISSSMSRSLKNETTPPPIESSLPLDLVPEPSLPLPMSIDPISSSLFGELIPISI
jgi:hypothetical protein